jgi:AraC-like DNA-binding protein/mannose-6-phosphate isomerase-like protein (cupin superfamily)
MTRAATRLTKLDELSWLADVRENVAFVDGRSSIWVRSVTVLSAESKNPVMSPEVHPYCEIGMMLEGAGTLFVDREEVQRRPGDLFLAGPGVPHWLKLTRFPTRFITVFFYPRVLMEQVLDSDDIELLRRFTAKQGLADRIVAPPPILGNAISKRLHELQAEFRQAQFGREFKLRALLWELLVDLMRWEQKSGRRPPTANGATSWKPLERALRFLKEHYREPIYASDLAKAAGVSESRLKAQFHEGLGMPWSRYLQCYRVHIAAALLNDTEQRITDAALAVGFESLSHFNATFREIMGSSPGVYARRVAGKGAGTAR